MADPLIDQLRARITSGMQAPGSHLTEAELAMEYGVSRTPVRSALRELSAEGLVTIEPNRGAFVTQWTTADAAEIMRLRTLLEAHAAELAAENHNAVQLGSLRTLCEQMDQVSATSSDERRTRLAELNRELHETILAAANSPRLFNIGRDLGQTPLMSSSFQYYSSAQVCRSLNDHRLIVEAIEQKDSRTAHALMTAHLSVAYAALSSGKASASI